MTGELFFEKLRNKEEDLESLFNLKSETHDVYWSGYLTGPDRSEFKRWFEGQIERNDREIWLVKTGNLQRQVIGYLYVTYSSDEDRRIGWLSHGVTENAKGKGVGTAIVHFVVNMFINGTLKADELQAWIVNENISSVKTFTKNGFVRSSSQKTEFYASMGKEVTLGKYFLKHQ